ncbi:hypothetical protein COOONC_27814, partial [Cooperia oncophora]
LKNWTSYSDDKNRVDVIYFDFLKIFDKVNDTTLLYKLEQIGLHSRIISWTRGRQNITGVRIAPTDVPQEGVLPSLLLSIHTHDLLCCRRSWELMFKSDPISIQEEIDIISWCKECQFCFLTSYKKQSIPSTSGLIGKTIRNGHNGPTQYAHLSREPVHCHHCRPFTKYLGAYPIPDKKAETVAEALFSNWICGCGRWPAALLSDRGSEFENSVMEALCSIMGNKQKFTKDSAQGKNKSLV